MGQTKPKPESDAATAEDAAFVYREWDERSRRGDVEALLDLYLSDAILETPLIPRVMNQEKGYLVGRDAIRPFFQRGTDNRPHDVVRWFRTGRYQFNGCTLIWEYPRVAPDGDQLDLVEVMELSGPQIAHHRIYWGWFGTPILTRASSDPVS